MNLMGKQAVVTGGGTGLGFSIAKALLAKGMRVAILGRRKEALQIAAKTLDSERLTTHVCDVSDFESVEKIINEIGEIQVLANVAGVYLEGKLQDYSAKDIHTNIDTNLKGVIFPTRTVLPLMLAKKEGAIINIASSTGLKARELQTVYAASKFGVRGFTDSLRLEVVGSGVRIMGIYPGGMSTGFFATSGNPKDNQSWMKTDRVAEAIVFALEHDDSLTLDHLEINRR